MAATLEAPAAVPEETTLTPHKLWTRRRPFSRPKAKFAPSPPPTRPFVLQICFRE